MTDPETTIMWAVQALSSAQDVDVVAIQTISDSKDGAKTAWDATAISNLAFDEAEASGLARVIEVEVATGWVVQHRLSSGRWTTITETFAEKSSAQKACKQCRREIGGYHRAACVTVVAPTEGAAT
jgi:uncharacterized alpha-E superfamily protein